CSKAMAKAPEDRYESAKALADDVQAHLENRPVRAYRAGPLERAVKAARRHRAVTATIAGAVLVGLVVALGALVRIARERAVAEERLAEIRRLADVRRLADYERAATDDLWPAIPERAPALRAWLEKARALAARLPIQRAKLAELRAAAGAAPGD